jgi:hypothetical protein
MTGVIPHAPPFLTRRVHGFSSLSLSLFLPTPLSAPAPISCLPWLMAPEHGGSSYLPSRTHATPTSARHVVALAHPHGRRRARVGYPVARRRCAAEMREESPNQSAGRGTERGMGLGVYVGAFTGELSYVGLSLLSCEMMASTVVRSVPRTHGCVG